MLKTLLSICLMFIFLVPGINAQTVNRDELGELGPVEFINYEGPYIRIDTRAQIRDIGFSLGNLIRNGALRAGADNRYFVINSRSPADGIRLDADIFGLGSDAMVDHIRNLRLIVQGYLEATYDYSANDAALLAQYITVYNAVYRGDMNFFEPRYKLPVLTHLSQERAGLSIRFDEWPGQTLMLIPLGTGLGGPLSAINTAALNEAAVRDQLRQEDDGSIDQRRDMVDLFEREAEQAMEVAAQLRQEALAEEQRIEAERIAALQRQQEAEAALRELGQGGTGDLEESQRQLEEAQQRLSELDEREAELERLREEAERQEQFAEERMTDAWEERQEIAADQQALIEAPPTRQQEAETVLGISMLNTAPGLGQLQRLERNTGRVVASSALNTVNARSVIVTGNRIIAIAGESSANSAIRLVEFNAQTLLLQRQGDDNIAPSSHLWLNGQDLFAIVTSGGNNYLARFSLNDFTLQSRSAELIHPNATVMITDNIITTQSANGSVLLLNRSDLTPLR